MKFLQKFYLWFLIFLLPFLLGLKHGGCTFLERIFMASCASGIPVENGYGKDVSGNSVIVGTAGYIYVFNGACSSGYSLITVPGQPELYDITVVPNTLTGNIIVGESGTLVRLTPEDQLAYPVNPAGNNRLRAVAGYGSNPQIIVAVGNAGTIIKSIDGGLNWTLVDFPSQADLINVEIKNDGMYIVVTGSEYTFSQSSDGGESWSFISPATKILSQGSFSYNAICFYDDNLGFVGGPWGLAYKTTDGGMNWTSFSIGSFESINSMYFSSPDSGIAVGIPGLAMFTTDGGASWFDDPDVTTFLNGQNITKIIPINKHIGIVLGEGGFSMIVADDSTLLSPVENEEKPSANYELSQNYPNPFNPSTKINYAIIQSGFVRISLYDILGNEIKTLVNEEETAGSYQLNFDASGLPSGVYYYQLRVGNFTETKKLVLLK